MWRVKGMKIWCFCLLSLVSPIKALVFNLSETGGWWTKLWMNRREQTQASSCNQPLELWAAQAGLAPSYTAGLSHARGCEKQKIHFQRFSTFEKYFTSDFDWFKGWLALRQFHLVFLTKDPPNFLGGSVVCHRQSGVLGRPQNSHYKPTNLCSNMWHRKWFLVICCVIRSLKNRSHQIKLTEKENDFHHYEMNFHKHFELAVLLYEMKF